MRFYPLVRVVLPCGSSLASPWSPVRPSGPRDTGPVESPQTSVGPNPTLPEPEESS